MNPASRKAAVVAILLAILAGGCDGNVTGSDEAAAGSIEVMLTMAGVDPDPNGGTIVVDGGERRLLLPDVPLTFFDVRAGNHALWVTDLSGNCLAANNPRSVTVVEGQTAQATFDAVCVGPAAELTVSKVAVGMVPLASQTIEVYATNDEGVEEGWTFASSDVAIAGASSSGNQLTVVGGEGFGKATIAVTSTSGVTVEIPVTVYDHMVLDVGDLLIKYVDTFELRGWSDWGGVQSWWHPVTEGDWKALGSLWTPNNNGPATGRFWAIVVQENGVTGALAPPDSFLREGGGNTMGGDLAGTWWTPVCPEGYVALGTVLGTRNVNTPVPPTTDDVTCVREDLTFEARVDPNTRSQSDRTPGGSHSGFWQITIPQLELHQHAFLEVGTFLMQGPDNTCQGPLAGALCWEHPTSHPVLHVLSVDLPMIIDTPEESRLPALTGFDQPPVQTLPLATKTMLVPFTALLGGTSFGGASVGWMVNNSPLVQVERFVANRLMYHGVNTTSVTQENRLEFISGVTTANSETYSVTTGISISYEAGVSFVGGSATTTYTASLAFGYESMRSVSSLQQQNTIVTIFTPPGKAAAAWQQRNVFRVKRHRGIELDVVGELEFGIDTYVVGEYPRER